MAVRKHYSTQFLSLNAGTQNDGTAASGTAGEINQWNIDGINWVQQVIGTQTVLVPSVGANGLDMALTDTNGQGSILAPFTNTTASPLCFTIGTSPAFFLKCKVKVTDWSGCQFMVGFHGGATIPAHTATFADYTDKAMIGNYAGGSLDVYTSTALNNAADVNTDTTINLADGNVATFYVYVSSAGVVTYAMDIGSTAQTLTTAAYTFDSGDTVVPIIFAICHTDTASNIYLQEFTCGLQ
jgi:hypothetical protein